MKRFVISAMALSAAFVFGAVSAQAGNISGNGLVQVSSYPAGTAATGVAASKHNLGSLSRGQTPTTGSTSEVCIFCHTPHWTNQTNGLIPLWNRGVVPSTYSAYGTTIGGTTVANSDIGSASLACLSCHDGVTTFDNLVNAPGSGGVTFATGTYNVVGVARGWVFGTRTSAYMGLNTIDGNNATGGQRLKIGTDLSNDHPVSVVYYADRAGLRATNTTIATIDLTSDLAASSTIAGNLTQNNWAVKGYVSSDAKISDLLRSGKVECSSCHDPHFKNQSWDEVETATNETTGSSGDGLFLRRVGGNSGSGVCRTCHNK